MLDKQTFEILFVLCKLCDSGYHTLDLCDISMQFGDNIADNEIIEELKKLSSKKLIILKYVDEASCCLMVTKEARNIVEGILQQEKVEKTLKWKNKKANLKVFLIGLLGGILGGALAASIFLIITIFV